MAGQVGGSRPSPREHLGPLNEEIADAASKGAMQQITATLSDTLIDRGITVNTVNPGPTDTGWAADVEPCAPTGRWGQPDDASG